MLQTRVGTERSLQILFLTYVIQKAETLLVGWLYFFGKFEMHIMMSFERTFIVLQQALER